VLPVRHELQAFDTRVVIGDVDLLSDRVAHLAAPQRIGSWLVGSFALVGMVLAVIGLYGLLSYVTAQRTREIGVRMALGARASDVAWLVVRAVLHSVGAGALAGMALSWWLARFVERMLFGIAPRDPLAFGCALALLGLAVLIAAFVPVRRAAHVDPMIALRAE